MMTNSIARILPFQPPMTLRILAAGGTIDKRYDPIKGTLTFTASYLPQIIARARVTAPFSIEELRLIDSLDMLDADRQAVLLACRRASETNIVIIHGTDTMCETGELLGTARLAKTIVLTGAMIPYEIANSDALFNVGFACGVAQTLPPGVYIAMNGTVFPWDRVQKNKSEGRFESRY